VKNDYRIHITIRRRGEPIATSNEFKTENFDNLEEVCNLMAHFANDAISDLEEISDYMEGEDDNS